METESRFNTTYISANAWTELSRIPSKNTFDKILKDVSDLYTHIKSIQINNPYEVEVYGIGNEYARELEQQQKTAKKDTKSIKDIIERQGIDFVQDIVKNKEDQ